MLNYFMARLKLFMKYTYNKLTFLLISIFMACGIFPTYAISSTPFNQDQADKMAGTLKNASTPDDSIKILYDVYDLSDRCNRKDVGLQILEIAQRTQNEKVLVDLISRLSNKVDDMEGLQRLMKYSSSLSADSAARGVDLVLEMEEAKQQAQSLTDKERHDKVVEFGRIDLMEKEDLYENIIDLYRAMVNLGVTSQGSLYLEYIYRLGELVPLLPEEDFAIRNLYYTTAALYYTRRGHHQQAIESDRELLRQIDKIEKKYAGSDRKYLDLSYVKYVSYRRMLDNYPGLSPQEVEDLYAKCVALAEENEEVRQLFGERGITKSSYFMARGEYDKAIPELKKVLSDSAVSNSRKLRVLDRLATAYNATGNSKEELETLREYAALLEQDKENRIQDAYNELEIRREIDKQAFRDNKEQEQQREENREMRKVSLTLVYVLALIIIFILQAYFRQRKKMRSLEEKNKKLHNNIEYIFDDGTPRGSRDLRKPSRERLKG